MQSLNPSPVCAKLLIYWKGYRWIAYDKGKRQIVCKHQSNPYTLLEWAWYNGYRSHEIHMVQSTEHQNGHSESD